MFRGIRIWSGQPLQDGTLVNRKSTALDTSMSVGILHLSVSKVKVSVGSIEQKHLVVTCALTVHCEQIATHVQTNCVARGVSFIEARFARHH